MQTSERELHLRGHRADVWKHHVQRLRQRGLPITIDNIVGSTNTDDFTVEQAQGTYDYSGGTFEGAKNYVLGKKQFLIEILTANPQTIVLVDSFPDSNCGSCGKLTNRHCDNYFFRDEEVTMTLNLFARRRGYATESTREQDQYNPSRTRLSVRIPAGAIQEYVLGE